MKNEMNRTETDDEIGYENDAKNRIDNEMALELEIRMK